MTDADSFEAQEEAEEEVVEDVDESKIVAPQATPLTYFGSDFDVHGLVRRLEIQDILVPTFDPEQPTDSGLAGFQRRFVWRKPQMDRFIESLLLGYPVPGIFFVEEPSKRLLVLDGQQRLRTLLAFYRNSFRENPYALENVDKDFYGLSYPKLTQETRRLLDNTFIHATIIRNDASEEGYKSIYQLFERLNTGGTNLQPQEIRVALFHGRFVDLLRGLNEYPAWRRLYGNRSERFKDQELILRFFALHHDRAYYYRPLKIFLNDYLNRHQNDDADACTEDRLLFEQTCDAILSGIGPSAFRLTRNLNAAMVDAVMIGVADRLAQGDIHDLSQLANAHRRLSRCSLSSDRNCGHRGRG